MKSDLPVRVASAIVMLLLAGGALWLGGPYWLAFVVLVALGVLWEWLRLVLAMTPGLPARAGWLAWGLLYVGGAAWMLLFLRAPSFGLGPVLTFAGAVVGTDVGAYFAGRAIGGPKIAPSISPSKTWAGLAGGMLGATAAFAVAIRMVEGLDGRVLAAAPVVAVIAQAGDFFESWMKRRAGVKDSGRLIPGHGGLFDRVDGLLAVMFALFLIAVGGVAFTLFSGGELLPSPA